MSSVPRPEAPSRRDEILRAALRCFLEHGYDATTIQDICARSGASVGSVYHAFSGKEAIAAELLSSALGDWQRRLLERLGAASDAEALVRAVVEHYIDWVVEDPDRARFLTRAPRARLEAHASDELRAQNAAHLRALRAVVKPHLGALRELPFDLLLPALAGPAIEWGRQWLAGTAKTGPREARRILSDVAWAAARRSH